jgi:hypothetical protein
MSLSIDNVINISVATTGAGVGSYNTSNLALLSYEAPVYSSFGNLGYKLYLSPTDVATDFGSASNTYKQALAVFSQQPNILAGGGYLAVVQTLSEVQTIAFSAAPTSGSFVLTFTEGATAAINWNDNAAAIQLKIRAVVGLENVLVTGSIAGLLLTIEFDGKYASQSTVLVGTNSLLATATPVTTIEAKSVIGEKYSDCITRASSIVPFFGVMACSILLQAEMLLCASVIQAMNKLMFFVSKTAADVAPGGMLDLLRSGTFTHSRGLYYGSTLDIDALIMMASYAGRALSVNFSGSNTTATMHLKDLSGVQPDLTVTQTILAQCGVAGVDVYSSIQGVAKVFCSGANSFFDDMYNLLAMVGDLQVAGFNFLAQSSTKIAQTEDGVTGLKSAYRSILEKYVSNQYLAAGKWTSPNTFGVQQDLYDNISQRGYYMYSLPVSLQTAADRAARKAPLIQIAAKEAGAVHSSSVIINVNL